MNKKNTNRPWVVVARIKQLKNLRTDAEVAGLLGVSTAEFEEYKKQAGINFEVAVIEWAHKENISFKWLLKGYNSGPPPKDKIEVIPIDPEKVKYIKQLLNKDFTEEEIIRIMTQGETTTKDIQ